MISGGISKAELMGKLVAPCFKGLDDLTFKKQAKEATRAGIDGYCQGPAGAKPFSTGPSLATSAKGFGGIGKYVSSPICQLADLIMGMPLDKAGFCLASAAKVAFKDGGGSNE